MERLLVYGGRDYTNQIDGFAKLDEVHALLGPLIVIQGGARGGDAIGAAWARLKGFPCIEMAANWDFYQRAAGPIRNQWMLTHCIPTFAVEFPGGSGTAHMRRLLERAVIPVY